MSESFKTDDIFDMKLEKGVAYIGENSDKENNRKYYIPGNYKYYITICIRYVNYDTMAYEEIYVREDFDEQQDNSEKALNRTMHDFYTKFKNCDIRGLDIVDMHLFD